MTIQPSKPKLLLPEAARAQLGTRYDNGHRTWLEGGGEWPLTIKLGSPVEQDLVGDIASMRGWVTAWMGWQPAGQVVWQERRWPRVGTQNLPASLQIATPRDCAALCGQESRWVRAVARSGELCERFPLLAGSGRLARHFDALADYTDDDFARLIRLLAWLQANLGSGYTLRQLPVVGLDTKWLEKKREELVTDLLRVIVGATALGDLYELTGLQRPPHRLRVSILCPQLRLRFNGMRDVEAPLDQWRDSPVPARRIIIVENKETGLAFPDIEGAIVFMRLGNAVSVLSTLPWLRECQAVYWGDIDTHGLFILNQARRALPQLCSVMMDEETLLQHRELWGKEPVQSAASQLPHLTHIERDLFDGLKSNRWGYKLRLEQERALWPDALTAVEAALSAG
ncbi:Wadjet anti-phage system protein JetD domain-containing protein [Rhizobacter fulvus]